MGRNKNQSFAKRKREQARQERATQKRSKRRVRSSNSDEEGPSVDDQIADIILGPQPKDEATDEEVQRAIESAMNPGKQHADGKGGKQFGKRLFVGNLERATEEHEIGAFFREAGYDVVEATLMRDRLTGESRGFAFVELASGDQAKKAITNLGGKALHGRELRINMADSGGRR